MTAKAAFYQAGCPACVETEQAGVKSVPALAMSSATIHINHGADLSALK